jgi:transposase
VWAALFEHGRKEKHPPIPYLGVFGIKGGISGCPFRVSAAPWGLQGWVVEQMHFHGSDELRLRIESTSPWHRCRRCGPRTTKAYDHRVRVLRDLSLFGRRVYLYVPQWRVECRVCQAIVSEDLELCARGQMMTRRYERYLAGLCELLCAQAVAQLEELSWSTVSHLDRKYLQLRQQAQRLENVRRIGIDEVAYKKGQNYVTVVSDLISRKVLWVGKDRSKATVAAFFAELGPAATAAIEVVAMDMSDPGQSHPQKQALGAAQAREEAQSQGAHQAGRTAGPQRQARQKLHPQRRLHTVL